MKAWWQSKTIWFNAIALVIAVADALQGFLYLADFHEIFASVVTVGNIILRFVTTQGISKRAL